MGAGSRRLLLRHTKLDTTNKICSAYYYDCRELSVQWLECSSGCLLFWILVSLFYLSPVLLYSDEVVVSETTWN